MSDTETKKWITVKILREMYGEISDEVSNSSHYTNETDFIRDACRDKLVALQKGRKN